MVCTEISDVRFRCGQVRIETGAEDADALSEFDARNALYGVFLQHLLATFRENAEVRRNHGPKRFHRLLSLLSDGFRELTRFIS